MPAKAPESESEAQTVPEPTTEIFANEENLIEPAEVESGMAPTVAQPTAESEAPVVAGVPIVSETAPGTERMPVTVEEPIPPTVRSAPEIPSAILSEPIVESGVRPIARTEEAQPVSATEPEIVMTVRGNQPVPPDMNLPPHVPSVLETDEGQNKPEDQQKAA